MKDSKERRDKDSKERSDEIRIHQDYSVVWIDFKDKWAWWDKVCKLVAQARDNEVSPVGVENQMGWQHLNRLESFGSKMDRFNMEN